MTSSIPDGISFSDLEGFADQAAIREEAEAAKAAEKQDAHFDGKTKDEVIDIAHKFVTGALEECNDPMTHKIMIMMILDNFLEWHTKAGLIQMEEGEERSTVCWLRDAGKFQAMHNILSTVTTGPNDWTVGE